MAFWRQNPLHPSCDQKHSISDGEKMAKFRIFGKIFDEICTFDKQKITFWRQNSLEPKYVCCTVHF